MYKRSSIFIAVALVLGGKCACALANDDTSSHLGAGIHDVTDQELAGMRGRFTVGDNTVVWFGVQMVSTFQTNTGQVVQGTMNLGLNFSKNPNNPQVSFVPTVTITTPNAPLPTAASVQSTISRSVQSGGIANVGGLVQSVQIAGDNNATANVTQMNIQSGGAPNVSTTGNTSSWVGPVGSGSSMANAGVSYNGLMANTNSSTTVITPTDGGDSTATNTPSGSTTNNGTSTSNGRTANVGNASVSSTYSNDSAEVTTSVAGEGSASQWIHAGSLGQTIALTTDNAIVTNQMIVNLVTQQLGSTAQLAHTLSQSLNLSHLNGH
ncbi:hypothetical protein [Dyella acidiphila]|uniref:Uncharacterized protein n=1 Tax=Dyella acidiphila TaxID=2775866 RepID=A0ABR9G8R2_9GAMM|nr:hypothetical protein [Dyella acidiphila]MBE1160404.1 hypothetical protein [Dyella acidiphila]